MGTLSAAECDRTVAPEEVLDGRVIADDFGEFYRAEYLPMVRLAFGLVDTPEAAEEITQDAFAKVFERWDRLRNPGGYLRTAVVNGARSELRKREVRRRILPGRPRQGPGPGCDSEGQVVVFGSALSLSAAATAGWGRVVAGAAH